MQKLLQQNIKSVLTQYPQISSILDNYNIGCSTCSSASCKFIDIIAIHGLNEQKQQSLFKSIAEIVYPGQNVTIPKISAPEKIAKKLSPIIKILMDEHIVIMRIVNAVGVITASDASFDKETMLKVLDFIRKYADKFHHAKEEDILFCQFERSLDIVKTMLEDHVIGRGHIKSARESLDKSDQSTFNEHLKAYAALLTEHIRKEDEILYPWMDSQ